MPRHHQHISRAAANAPLRPVPLRSPRKKHNKHTTGDGRCLDKRREQPSVITHPPLPGHNKHNKHTTKTPSPGRPHSDNPAFGVPFGWFRRRPGSRVSRLKTDTINTLSETASSSARASDSSAFSVPFAWLRRRPLLQSERAQNRHNKHTIETASSNHPALGHFDVRRSVELNKLPGQRSKAKRFHYT